jgi:Protein of unknown function (DUF4236)
MTILFRKIIRLGPIHLNFADHGFSSWSVKIGRWSWNSRTRKQRVNLPGPISWRSGGK